MNKFQQVAIREIKKLTGIKEVELEVPPDPKLGDFAFPCFALSKEQKKAPAETAKSLAAELSTKSSLQKYFREIKPVGPYINFFINETKAAEETLKKIREEKKDYGKSDGHGTIMIEYSQPNTNKPQHLGHVRNNVLGMSLANSFELAGKKVIKVNLINDRGIHICKSMLAYQKWGHGKTPDSENKKGDHLVGDFYVLYNKEAAKNPELEKEARELLVKWEHGDKETRALWKKMNSWVLEGFDETYKKLGIKFDKVYYESGLYEEGKKIILDALKKGIAKKNAEGAIYIDLSDYGLGEKILIRSDGTSIYITQDIYLAILRHKEQKLDKLIYVVASEQNHHFKTLFKILELLGYKWAKSCYHLSYGMVYLPEGKMKSREGTVVDADDLIAEMLQLAKKEIIARHKELGETDIQKRAEQIGIGALKFHLLKYDPVKDITYNPEESIKFEGDTGPYVQYAHARCCSILEKYGKQLHEAPTEKIDFGLLKKDEEIMLIKHLAKFPETVQKAAEQYKPSLIAHYSIESAQLFSEFYHQCLVISEDEELTKARILLVYCVRQVLENGLAILGIDAPEKM